MVDYQELHDAHESMQVQDSLYRPTSFWEASSTEISAKLEKFQIERFRSLPEALDFFVPTYGVPGNGFTTRQKDLIESFLREMVPDLPKLQMALQQFLSGTQSALSDYRCILAGDDTHAFPYLHDFSESEFGEPFEQFTFDNRRFSRSSLNYLLGLTFLKKHLDGFIPKTVLEIGGGFGTLGEILATSGIADLKYIDIDIPPMHFISQYYLSMVLGKENVRTFAQTKIQLPILIESLPLATSLCSWQIANLQGKVDLFVNFISFQEMEPEVVANYLFHVTRLGTTWILLRNMREGKEVHRNGSIGVKSPILSEDYIELLDKYRLVARNVIPFGYKTVDGFHSELLLFRRR